MLIYRDINQFENSSSKHEVPPIIANAVIGDLLMFDRYLEKENGVNIVEGIYIPSVIILSSDEFEKFTVPTIDKNNYEYRDIVGISKEYFVTKYLYLYDNGETGLVIYVVTYFNKELKPNSDIYITQKVKQHIPTKIIQLLVESIEHRKKALLKDFDYLQVFNIKTENFKDVLISTIELYQECPEYKTCIYLIDEKIDDCKLFWIDDEDENGHTISTLMLAEEY